jgi:hypothetical protein
MSYLPGRFSYINIAVLIEGPLLLIFIREKESKLCFILLALFANYLNYN